MWIFILLFDHVRGKQNIDSTNFKRLQIQKIVSSRVACVQERAINSCP